MYWPRSNRVYHYADDSVEVNLSPEIVNNWDDETA